MTPTNFPYPLFLTNHDGAWHSGLRAAAAYTATALPPPPTPRSCQAAAAAAKLATCHHLRGAATTLLPLPFVIFRKVL